MLIIIAAIKGKKVAENPKLAIVYELQKGPDSLAKLQEKIGLNSSEFRKVLLEMESEEEITLENNSPVGRIFSLKK